ncbi:MAG: helix-turn-helix domain-containing protein [Planctomycetaceae bacterium]|nr:helix-turn-helix domain-containing protein [Planctomycetaceae bacterium]
MRPTESSPQQMIDVREVATILSVSTRTVWRLISRGEIPQPIRFGRNVRWRQIDIESWIASQSPNGHRQLARRPR